jgi:hypothetical protein
VPKIIEYLEYILELRTQHSRENQGIKYIPIHDPYYKHPDYEIHPRQRIWFDIPVLRYPDWQSIQILPKEFDAYLIEALEFMKANSNVDNFAGFYDFEIAKLERNLSIMQERDALDIDKLEIDRHNFVRFFEQYDERNSVEFLKTFPEFKNFFQLCKSVNV